MQEKSKNALKIVICTLLAAVLVLNVFTLLQMNKVKAAIDFATGSGGDIAQENDVTIAGSYVIKSTEKISNAYKSGSTAGLTDKEKETLDMASSVLDEIIEDGMTDYEKELAVYDWMTHSLRYDSGALLVIPSTEADADNPFGVLKYHNAVCVGYATTFRLFMQMMDIECMVVHNTELYHTWNLVKLDGDWYHTDIYSDSDTGNYTHFNLSDSAMMSSQTWNQDFFPAADGTKYNYALQNTRELDDLISIPKAVRENLDNGEIVFSFSFKQAVSDADAPVSQAILEGIKTYVENSNYRNIYDLTWSWTKTDDKGYVLSIYSASFDEDSPEDQPVNITDEQYQEITDAVSASFGDLGDYYSDEGVQYYG